MTLVAVMASGAPDSLRARRARTRPCEIHVGGMLGRHFGSWRGHVSATGELRLLFSKGVGAFPEAAAVVRMTALKGWYPTRGYGPFWRSYRSTAVVSVRGDDSICPIQFSSLGSWLAPLMNSRIGVTAF